MIEIRNRWPNEIDPSPEGHTDLVQVETITSYKGFDKDFKCRGYQFEVGKTFKHDGAVKACESGFHACEYPLDVFGYYPPSGNRFAVVEQSGELSSGELSRDSGDSKVASESIFIKKEIGVADLVEAAIEYTTSRCEPIDPESPASATGERGAASATGEQGAASATGARGAASATGYKGAASATGEASVAVSTGWAGRAQAAEGCAIVLAFRDNEGRIAHIRASKVGENGIKANTWYALDANRNFVEVT